MTEEELVHRVKRLERLNEIVKGFDPVIRADAFKMLGAYVLTPDAGQSTNPGALDAPPVFEDRSGNGVTRESFFTTHAGGKPAENVMLVCAYFYSEYGMSPITAMEINAIAGEVGLTVPTRADMTMAQAQRDGKALFRSEGEGKYRCTVHGELFLQRKYNVTKGRKVKASDAQ